jgi:hypothetical protein
VIEEVAVLRKQLLLDFIFVLTQKFHREILFPFQLATLETPAIDLLWSRGGSKLKSEFDSPIKMLKLDCASSGYLIIISPTHRIPVRTPRKQAMQHPASLGFSLSTFLTAQVNFLCS